MNISEKLIKDWINENSSELARLEGEYDENDTIPSDSDDDSEVKSEIAKYKIHPINSSSSSSSSSGSWNGEKVGKLSKYEYFIVHCLNKINCNVIDRIVYNESEKGVSIDISFK